MNLEFFAIFASLTLTFTFQAIVELLVVIYPSSSLDRNFITAIFSVSLATATATVPWLHMANSRRESPSLNPALSFV